MLWLCLLVWDYLHLYGGGLVLGIIVFSLIVRLLTVDIGPRTNTEVIVGEELPENAFVS